MLLDFDDNFPGVKNNNLEAIFAVIKKCNTSGKDALFGQTQEMKYTRTAYQISNKEEQSIGDQYKSQCPKSFLGAMIKDASTFKLMMIGQKQNIPYIQNLVDDYLRCRVDVFLKTKQPLAVTDWMKNHPHFKMLKNISNTNLDLVSAAVKGFVARICPVLLFQSVSKIQGSILETANLVKSAINFVCGEAKKEANCPFQIDICIGFDPMKSTVNSGDADDDDDDDDDDGDDDDDNKTDGQSVGGGIDRIGDIITKLESNKDKGITYAKAQDIDRRVIRDCYKKYQDESKKESLQGQRIIGFVDKRGIPFKFNEKDEKDEQKEGEHRMFIYSAPNDCNTIPSDAVNEWYLSSTSMCLIPNEGYKLQKMMSEGDSKSGNKQVNSTMDKMKHMNIGSKDNAAMITVSFHVKSVDCIACYIYAMGQYTRFMPSDIVNILPLLFDEKFGDNALFGTSPWDQDVSDLEKVLVDKQFEKFRKAQCGWKPPVVDKKGKDDSK